MRQDMDRKLYSQLSKGTLLCKKRTTQEGISHEIKSRKGVIFIYRLDIHISNKAPVLSPKDWKTALIPFYYAFLEAIWIKNITPSKIQPVPHCHRRLSRKTGQHPVQYDEMVRHQNALRAYFEHFPLLGGDSPPRP